MSNLWASLTLSACRRPKAWADCFFSFAVCITHIFTLDHFYSTHAANWDRGPIFSTIELSLLEITQYFHHWLSWPLHSDSILSIHCFHDPFRLSNQGNLGNSEILFVKFFCCLYKQSNCPGASLCPYWRFTCLFPLGSTEFTSMVLTSNLISFTI